MELERLQKQILLLEKTNKTLIEAMSKDNYSTLEQDWAIQRFDYTIELTWKTLKKVLEYEWQVSNLFPKEIFKECFKADLIDDLDIWFDLLDQRNTLSHFYSEYISNRSFEFIKSHYSVITFLVEKLKDKYVLEKDKIL